MNPGDITAYPLVDRHPCSNELVAKFRLFQHIFSGSLENELEIIVFLQDGSYLGSRIRGLQQLWPSEGTRHPFSRFHPKKIDLDHAPEERLD